LSQDPTPHCNLSPSASLTSIGSPARLRTTRGRRPGHPPGSNPSFKYTGGFLRSRTHLPRHRSAKIFPQQLVWS